MSDNRSAEKRVVVCAAVKLKSGKILCGVRHFDDLMRQHLPRKTEEAIPLLSGAVQGFVDNYGKFLDRSEAWHLAESIGQIRPYSLDYRGISGSLFSEDLY